MKRGLRGALLAAGSVMAVAMAMGGRAEALPVTCSVATNPGLPYTQSGNTCVTFTATPTGSGAVTNNGTVNASGASNPTGTGVSVMTGATVNGDIVNNGAINATNYGVLVQQGAVTGSVTNATGATISVTNSIGAAIYLKGPTASIGSITNNGTLTGGIYATGDNVTGSTVGAVINRGTITVGGITGVNGADITVSNMTVNGDVSNTGRLNDSSTGAIQIINSGVINGSVLNSGTINNTNPQGAGIYIFPPSSNGYPGQLITGSVSNQLGGAITGGYGIQVFATNSAFPVEIKGDVTNGGTITASQSGIEVGSAVVDGAITNTGKITATSGNGIQVIDLSKTPGGTTLGTAGAPNIKGGVTNSGTITAGQSGIDVADASVGGVTNAKSATITASSGAGIRVAKTGQVIFSGGTGFTTGSAGATVSGDVKNAGTIDAKTGIAVIQGSTVTGDINNTGTISSVQYGIYVNQSTVNGSITNATGATISATNDSGGAIYLRQSDTGAITNDGVINGAIIMTGAKVAGITVGTITNNGTINAGPGPGQEGVDIWASELTVNGDIVNTGKLNDNSTGAIQIVNTGVGNGSVTNSGTINNTYAQGAGIYIFSGSDVGPYPGEVITGSVSNAKGGTIDAAFGIQVFSTSASEPVSIHGDVTNAGTINASQTGIELGSGQVTGSVVNSGQITATHGNGIQIINLAGSAGSLTGGPGVVAGSVRNTGTITAKSNEVAGIFLAGAEIGGDVSNSGTINASGGGAGIAVGDGAQVLFSSGTLVTMSTGPSLISGTLSNSGKINAGWGLLVVDSAIGDGIENSGKINATNVGIQVSSGALVFGGIANTAGSISGANDGILIDDGSIIEGNLVNDKGATISSSKGAGIEVSFAGVFGGINNQGTINGVRGILVDDSASVFGGIVNHGAINAKTGILIAGTSSGVIGGIVNNGTITATGDGIVLNGGFVFDTKSGGTDGGITNTGTITGANGIVLANGAFVSAPIANSGDITATGAAIDIRGEGSPTTIDQEGGTITGAIMLSANSDLVNITGGAINGNIVGGGSANEVFFSLGNGSFDYKYAFTNIGLALFEGGTVTLEGADTPAQVTIQSGEVIVGNNGAFGTAAPYVYGGVTLGFLGNADYQVANNFTFDGTVAVAVPGGTVQTISGVISDGTDAGVLHQTGSGVLNLTGHNTFSGGATVESGTIRVGVDTVGSVGAITSSAIGRGDLTIAGGTLQAGGSFTVDNAASVNAANGTLDSNGFVFTYAGQISGGGGLNIVDSSGSGGMVVLTNANTYSGGTVLDGGVLRVGNSSAIGAGQLTFNGGILQAGGDYILDNAATVNATNGEIDSAGHSFTYAGAIGGPGALIITDSAGGGTVVLTGTDTYSGGTSINAGALQIGDGGTSGSITGNVADNGVLAFDRSDDVSFAGTITGAGELAQEGSGTLTLTGTSSVGSTVVEAGTLIVSGALTSTYTIETGATLQGSTTTLLTSNPITDNGTLVYDQSADGFLDNATAIEGTGALVKDGVGLLTLNGINSVGSTVINSGNLRIGDAGSPGAQLTSATVLVNPNGTLSGHGTIVGSVTNDGTVAPGGTIGVLTIKGNYTQTSTGVLSIEITPTANSELVVTGTANLAGSVVLVADPGNYRKGQTYTYLSAATINGAFSSLTNTAGLNLGGPGLLTGSAVVLTGVFTPVGSTGNQTAIGQALVNVPVGVSSDFDTIASAVLSLSSAPQNAALSQLGGEVDADLPAMARDSARTFLGGISEQLRTNGAGSDAVATGDPWGRAYGNFGSVTGDANAHGYDDTSGGVMLGASHAVGPDALVGAAFDYEHTDINLKSLPQSGDMNIWAGALYGEAHSGPLFFDAAGSLAYDSNSSTRHIDFSTISRLADGSFGGFTGSVMGTVGERIPFGMGMVFEPSASLIYTHVHQDGFTETNGNGADLAVDPQSQDALESILEGKVTKTYAMASGAVLRASLKGGWGHEFDSTATDITEAFAVAGGTPFTLAGADTGHNYGLFGASLNYDVSKRLSFFGRYDGAYGDRETNNAVSVGFSMKW